jgi:hypothetical protein
LSGDPFQQQEVAMPSSFSRFLSDDELQRVRQLYLESVEKNTPKPEDTPSRIDSGEPASETEADPAAR